MNLTTKTQTDNETDIYQLHQVLERLYASEILYLPEASKDTDPDILMRARCAYSLQVLEMITYGQFVLIVVPNSTIKSRILSTIRFINDVEQLTNIEDTADWVFSSDFTRIPHKSGRKDILVLIDNPVVNFGLPSLQLCGAVVFNFDSVEEPLPVSFISKYLATASSTTAGDTIYAT